MARRWPLAIVSLMFIALQLAPHISFDVGAQGVDETPALEWVEADIDVIFDSYERMGLDVVYRVHEADLGLGYGVHATDLRGIIAGDGPIVDDILSDLTSDLEDCVNGTLASLDLDGAYRTVTGPELLDLGTDDHDDLYREPVTFGASVHVYLRPEAVGLPTAASLDDLVKGSLKMGGTMNLSIELSAEAGHMKTYTFIPPPETSFKAGEALVGEKTFAVDARGSLEEVDETRNLVFASSSPAHLTEELRAMAVLDMVAIDELHVDINVSIGAVGAGRISPYFPEVIGLDHVSADGIRMTVANGLMSWTDIYTAAISDEVAGLEDDLSETLDVDVHLVLEWVPDSLVGYDVGTMEGAPVLCQLTANISLDLMGISAELAILALGSGAKAPFEVAFDTDLDWEASIILPTDVVLEGTGLARTVLPSDRYEYSWSKGWGGLSGHIAHREPYVSDLYGVVAIELKVQGIDTDLGRALGSGMTTVTFKIDVSISVWSVPLSGELAALVPTGVDMRRATPDFVRRALAEGEVSRDTINESIDLITPEVSQQVTIAIGKEVDLRLFLVDQTLGPDATGPIELKGSAKASRDKDIDSEDMMQRVIEVGHRFVLRGREGWHVDYFISFPEGYEIVGHDHDIDKSLLPTAPKVSDDRREFIEVILGNNIDNVTIHVKPTLGKSVSEAIVQPICFGPIILVIVAIIASIYLWRTRRRRGKARKGGKRKGVRRERDRGDDGLDDMTKGRGVVRRDRPPTGARAGRRPPRRADVEEMVLPKDDGPPIEKRSIRCPGCGRRFRVDPRYSSIICPQCGRKGKLPARGTKMVRCPRCGETIRYREGERMVRCSNCGKEGRVR